jgi:hypothetical protein
MTVQSPPGPPVARPDVDAGVINDARARQRRQRRTAALLAVVLAACVGLIAYATRAGGDAVKLPPPGATTGALRPLPSSNYQYWVTPTLVGGQATVDVSVQYGGGGSSCVGGCADYVGRGAPIGIIASAPSLSSPVGLNVSANVILFVAPDVAAVRVGSLGTAAAKPGSGLPAGDKIVAYVLPRAAHPAPYPWRRPAQLTALNSNGRPLTTPPILGSASPRRITNWTTTAGACAVSASMPGLVDIQRYVAQSIPPVPASDPAPFFSCLEDKYALGPARFNVAILLNAHHPGQPPAALWNTTRVPGHPGIVEIAPPPQYPPNQDTSAPLYARRVGNAWLVVQARPGFAPNPSPVERTEVLNSLHISRIDLSR